MENDKKKKNSYADSLQYLNFLEELTWLLESNTEINFKCASKYFKNWRNAILHGSCDTDNANQTYQLIGVLPSLLKDTELFPNNLQLAQFSEQVLSLSIPRWEKRSRNEIIGLIVCEVEDANKQHLDEIAHWAENIIIHKSQVKTMQAAAKKDGNIFSWNETIQKLTGDGNEQKNR